MRFWSLVLVVGLFVLLCGQEAGGLTSRRTTGRRSSSGSSWGSSSRSRSTTPNKVSTGPFGSELRSSSTSRSGRSSLSLDSSGRGSSSRSRSYSSASDDLGIGSSLSSGIGSSSSSRRSRSRSSSWSRTTSRSSSGLARHGRRQTSYFSSSDQTFNPFSSRRSSYSSGRGSSSSTNHRRTSSSSSAGNRRSFSPSGQTRSSTSADNRRSSSPLGQRTASFSNQRSSTNRHRIYSTSVDRRRSSSSRNHRRSSNSPQRSLSSAGRRSLNSTRQDENDTGFTSSSTDGRRFSSNDKLSLSDPSGSRDRSSLAPIIFHPKVCKRRKRSPIRQDCGYDQQSSSADQQSSSADQQSSSADQRSYNADQQSSSADQQNYNADQQSSSADVPTNVEQLRNELKQLLKRNDENLFATDRHQQSHYIAELDNDAITTIANKSNSYMSRPTLNNVILDSKKRIYAGPSKYKGNLIKNYMSTQKVEVRTIDNNNNVNSQTLYPVYSRYSNSPRIHHLQGFISNHQMKELLERLRKISEIQDDEKMETELVSWSEDLLSQVRENWSSMKNGHDI